MATGKEPFGDFGYLQGLLGLGVVLYWDGVGLPVANGVNGQQKGVSTSKGKTTPISNWQLDLHLHEANGDGGCPKELSYPVGLRVYEVWETMDGGAFAVGGGIRSDRFCSFKRHFPPNIAFRASKIFWEKRESPKKPQKSYIGIAALDWKTTTGYENNYTA